MLSAGRSDQRPMKHAATILQEYFVALLQTQHPQGMNSFILRQFRLVGCLRNIEKSYFLHEILLLRNSSRKCDASSYFSSSMARSSASFSISVEIVFTGMATPRALPS